LTASIFTAVTDEDLPSHFFTVARLRSIPNPLHVLEQHLLAAAIIKLCRPAVGVAGNALSGFKGAIVLEKIRDTGRPE
jgi:hypothetical protein